MPQPITSSQVYEVLGYYFGNLIDPTIFSIQVIVLDKEYLTTQHANDIRNAIVTDPVLWPDKYRANIFDCDDYVFYLKTKISLLVASDKQNKRPHAFGVILTEKHAFNFGIGDNGDLYIVNTQSTLRDYLYPQNIHQLHSFLDLKTNNRIKLILI